MTALQRTTNNYEQTVALGGGFARILKRGDIVCLFGDLGAGKTAFVRGMAAVLAGQGHSPHVHSPTFTLMNIYPGKIPVYHYDLYRISAADLVHMGYEEFFYGDGVTAIEWSERLGMLMPADYWKVELSHAGEDSRVVALGFAGERLKQRARLLGEELA